LDVAKEYFTGGATRNAQFYDQIEIHQFFVNISHGIGGAGAAPPARVPFGRCEQSSPAAKLPVVPAN
jgi:hypothetical protein